MAQKPMLRAEVLISPTHKQTEGRAPVWGSEYITQAATPKGDSAEISPTSEV
jgi:hypothetical protein